MRLARLIRPRWRLRTLLVLVALAALPLGLWSYWVTWLRDHDLAVMYTFRARVDPRLGGARGLPLGQPVPILLSYRCGFEEILGTDGTPLPRPPFGMPVVIRMEARVEDGATGAVVGRCRMTRCLVKGLRESDSGEFLWRVQHDRPDLYMVCARSEVIDVGGMTYPADVAVDAYRVD